MKVPAVGSWRGLSRNRAQPPLPDEQKWNSSIHYFGDLLALAPARAALDVGCGDGLLVRKLAPLVGSVLGLDRDEGSIAAARAAGSGDPGTFHNVDFQCADLFDADLEPGSFDLVVCVAAVHHMNLDLALRRMADLLEPGGRLGIIGLTDSRTLVDRGWQITYAAGSCWYRWIRRRKVWSQTAPIVWPPPHTFGQVRQIVSAELPNAILRRRWLGRYTLVWTKPFPGSV